MVDENRSSSGTGVILGTGAAATVATVAGVGASTVIIAKQAEELGKLVNSTAWQNAWSHEFNGEKFSSVVASKNVKGTGKDQLVTFLDKHPDFKHQFDHHLLVAGAIGAADVLAILGLGAAGVATGKFVQKRRDAREEIRQPAGMHTQRQAAKEEASAKAAADPNKGAER